MLRVNLWSFLGSLELRNLLPEDIVMLPSPAKYERESSSSGRIKLSGQSIRLAGHSFVKHKTSLRISKVSTHLDAAFLQLGKQFVGRDMVDR